MRWDKGYDSPDVEDRRDEGPAVERAGGGVGFLLPLFFRFGWKGVLVGLLIYAGARYFMGGTTQHVASRQHAGHDEARAFVGYVLDDVQKMWAERLNGYEKARVVLYSEATTTGCGMGEAAVGPFYCPRDE